jgi:hypothetical protein
MKRVPPAPSDRVIPMHRIKSFGVWITIEKLDLAMRWLLNDLRGISNVHTHASVTLLYNAKSSGYNSCLYLKQ